MRTRKNIIAILTLCATLSLTACSGKDTAKDNSTATDNTAVSEATEAASNSGVSIDDLYQQENQLFADHKEAWDKAFMLMSKSTADPSGNYADYLADTVESNKDSFTDDEYETLSKDIETIRGIEAQIAELENKTNSSDTAASESSSEESSPFKNLSATDYDGNSVDETLFSKNAVTVLNFWFTGCKPCVAELGKLDELNETLKSMGGEVIGINTETFDGNEDTIAEAKQILESQGAKYRNLSVASDSDAGKYASSIMAFPTTILVDRNGNIVGEPLLGGIDNQDNYDSLMKQIQSVIDADKAN